MLTLFVQLAVFEGLWKWRTKSLDSETFHTYQKNPENPKITISTSHFHVFIEFFIIFYLNLRGMSEDVIFKNAETHRGKLQCIGYPNML